MTKEEADNNKPESTTANNARNKGRSAKARGNHVQKTIGPPKIEFSGVCTQCVPVCVAGKCTHHQQKKDK